MVAVVAIGAVANGYSGLRVCPSDLSARAAMAEGTLRIGVTKAAVVALGVTGDD